LSHAASIIQFHAKYYIARKGFYNEESNKYIDSDLEEEELKQPIVKGPAKTLMA
jgi:hypothetical protein